MLRYFKQGAAGRSVQQSKSPDQLRTELDLARSRDGGRPECFAWNVGPPAVDYGCHSGAKVGPVEQIESLSPELDLHFLAQQIVVFEQRKIEVFQARSAQGIASEVAQLAGSRK
jgi:hypothetical protein